MKEIGLNHVHVITGLIMVGSVGVAGIPSPLVSSSGILPVEVDTNRQINIDENALESELESELGTNLTQDNVEEINRVTGNGPEEYVIPVLSAKVRDEIPQENVWEATRNTSGHNILGETDWGNVNISESRSIDDHGLPTLMDLQTNLNRNATFSDKANMNGSLMANRALLNSTANGTGPLNATFSKSSGLADTSGFDETDRKLRGRRKSGKLEDEPAREIREDEAFAGGGKVTHNGPSWEDAEVVGKLIENSRIPKVVVSHKIAAKLCQQMSRQEGNSDTKEKLTYYLWAPINQYLPMIRKAFPIRAPLFAPDCLKWVLRQCRGAVRAPLLSPCTYWAPMPIRRPECGFNPWQTTQRVNYRLPRMVPGNCPCEWPCTARFDPIQRCKVAIAQEERSVDEFDEDGNIRYPKELIIQDNWASQLCRSMTVSTTTDDAVPIGWLPIRAHLAVPKIRNGQRKKRDVGSFGGRIKRNVVSVKSSILFDETDKSKSQDKPEHARVNGKSLSKDISFNQKQRLLQQSGLESISPVPLRNCSVWKYQSCPPLNLTVIASERENENQGEHRHEEERRRGVGKQKRDSKVVPLKDVNSIAESNQKCNEWVQHGSTDCILEEPVLPSTTEDEVGGYENSKQSRRKTIVKELCPGSPTKFPCFLRKKREIKSDNDEYSTSEEYSEETDEEKTKTDLKRDATSSSIHLVDKIFIRPDPSCMCDWPCLPFFDRINKCYTPHGELLTDNLGKPKIPSRSIREWQRDPVECLNFIETDEIFCKINESL